jgi:hypothetical protein
LKIDLVGQVTFPSKNHYFKFTFQSNDVQSKDHFDKMIIVIQTSIGQKFFSQTFFGNDPNKNDVFHPKQNENWFSFIDI